MATTFYHPDAKASWQGDYFPRMAGPNGEPTWVTFSVSVTAAQAVENNIFHMCKLSADTLVLGGYVKASGLDVHASTSGLIDVGFTSDSNGHGDTNSADWFVDGAVLPTLTGSVIAQFGEANSSGYGIMPFVPSDTNTTTGANATGYFVTAKLNDTVAQAGAGVITVGLLIANKDFVTPACVA